ncbi:hypothetical protein M8818_001998 [Zalaria obscura]|uniref:Uncharacterized protein n=1 Tax=Zalaria obscura TaxID=2024903 RepID=A0ACC3SJ35_9PEZI
MLRLPAAFSHAATSPADRNATAPREPLGYGLRRHGGRHATHASVKCRRIAQCYWLRIREAFAAQAGRISRAAILQRDAFSLTGVTPQAEQFRASAISMMEPSEVAIQLSAPGINSSSPPSHHLSSLYVTFKVAQLVSNFRKRVKTRVLSCNSKKELPISIKDELCAEFEKEASQEIAKLLGRNKVHANDTHHLKSRPRRVTLTKEVIAPACDKVASHQESLASFIDSLVKEVDERLQAKYHPLSSVAAKDILFLKQGLIVVNLSNVSTAELVAVFHRIQLLLASIKQAYHCCFGKALCLGNEVSDGTLDETYLANLQHLLLVLHLIDTDHPGSNQITNTAEDFDMSGYSNRANAQPVSMSEMPRFSRPLSGGLVATQPPMSESPHETRHE